MVSTRRSRKEEPASPPASLGHDESDSDDAPEEVTLSSSRNVCNFVLIESRYCIPSAERSQYLQDLFDACVFDCAESYSGATRGAKD